MKKCLLLLVLSFLPIITSAQFVNYQVNNPTAQQPNEVTIAVNPTNTNYVAVGSNLNYFYSSKDGGKTWSQSIMGSAWNVWGDPCVIYNADGKLFYGHLSDGRGISGRYFIDRIVVQRSPDNGATWDYDSGIGFNPPIKQQDKEWLCADLTNSQFRNNLYVAWTEFDRYGSDLSTDSSRILFSRSTNNGATWSSPIRVNTRAGDCIDSDNTVEGAVPTVGPYGEVYLSWSGPFGITFAKSANGGVSFGNNVHVANLASGWDYSVPGIYRCNGMPITGCDISNSSSRGFIYISWSDQKKNDTDIYFSRSTDGGTTWSAPQVVNNDFSNRHQFFNWMCVDPVTGIIYIIFYDRRDNADPTDVATEVYLARSDDGGINFQNFKISQSNFRPSANIFFGDYTNISAYGGKIFPIWMRLDGQTMSVWTAPITDSQLITSVPSERKPIETSYQLYQNYPNPFNPTTSISYELPVRSFVSLKVFDSLGREISSLVNEVQPAGNYSVDFDANSADKFSSGVYLYRLIANDYVATKKMILIK